MGEEGEGGSLDDLHERNRTPATRPVAVRVPEPLLEDIDDIWEGEYATRSEFVRRVLHHVAANPDEYADLRGRDGRSARRK
jgi:Arc/MetJ-type ribon-helix-helix transcriptional regulator